MQVRKIKGGINPKNAKLLKANKAKKEVRGCSFIFLFKVFF